MTESDEERALGGVHGKMLKVCKTFSRLCVLDWFYWKSLIFIGFIIRTLKIWNVEFENIG